MESEIRGQKSGVQIDKKLRRMESQRHKTAGFLYGKNPIPHTFPVRLFGPLTGIHFLPVRVRNFGSVH